MGVRRAPIWAWGESTLAPLRDGIVWNLRMPRTLLAAVCGAGLAVCGAVMQSLLRNPLADPFVLGVSSGASTGAVAVVVLGVGGGVVSLSAGAFLGALLSFAMVLLLSHVLGGSIDRVVLSGVAAMQLFSALTSFIVLTSADAETTRGVLFWLLGSLSGRRLERGAALHGRPGRHPRWSVSATPAPWTRSPSARRPPPRSECGSPAPG